MPHMMALLPLARQKLTALAVDIPVLLLQLMSGKNTTSLYYLKQYMTTHARLSSTSKVSTHISLNIPTL